MMLTSGQSPELLSSSLVEILQFQPIIPVGADIEKMFHQVQVPEEDQSAYRFVYRTPGSSTAPLTYHMTVHVFGSISSSTTCIYTLNRTADDHRDQFPEAADSVRRTFYVDNDLDSFDSEDERTFLSIISSVYDPLGLVAPVTFLMKSLLQDIWTYETRIGWDDLLPEELRERFLHWYEHLENFETLSVPLCYRFNGGSCKQQWLHVFTDASSKDFGAVAYFRSVYEDHSIDVSFVMSKTHVTPFKGLTIPRLELQAAAEGLNIALTVCRELGMDLQDVTFHTDSQTVLRWIYSRTCKFEVFVNNRVGKILRNTNRRQWRHVAGVKNPADLCSRGIDPQNVNELFQFHQGPQFLQLDPSEWNNWVDIAEPEESDVNVIRILAIKTEDENHPVDQCVKNCSSLLRYQRVLAWCLRFVRNTQSRKHGDKLTVGELTVLEMSTSLVICVKRAQALSFKEEIYALRKNLELPLTSKLRPFKPFLDDVGQLRVGGRIHHAPVDYSAKHPILLPRDQLLTQRIVWDHPVKNLHVKAETLLAKANAAPYGIASSTSTFAGTG
ncbi:uncharacterized protein LOC116932504 [Daphnia magna]|uniref:uncharacterized protein LOC116932504 n=1 Tax=Daphnia magna TaxID=35525 RepID=UPI001E1BAFED|nr:uncharacterized protein LOC116932504 [Daphnia magna]